MDIGFNFERKLKRQRVNMVKVGIWERTFLKIQPKNDEQKFFLMLGQ